MWKRIFGKRHKGYDGTSTLSTQTYFDDENPKKYDNEKLLSESSLKILSIDNKSSKNTKSLKRLITENQGTGSSTVFLPVLTENGNQTSLHGISENGMQTEVEPPSATLLVRCEVGNQTDIITGGRGEVPQVEAVMSYETPLDTFRNQHPIVTPAELLQALQELAMQQDASGDF